ncbi:MAG: hypothetical protein ACRD09_08600 [Vicinamibacterales bacterium]
MPQLTPGAKRVAVIPGRWERVEALRPGSPLIVRLKSRVRLEGAFKALRPGVLCLTDTAGREISVPRSGIGKIEMQEAGDGLANGVLIGAGIGLGAAVAILTVAGAGEGYLLPSAKWGAPLLLSSVGGLAGALIDRAQKSQVIYLAP